MADCSHDQNPFECPICLQLLTDPVTIGCGHSFCMNCIKKFWDVEDQKGVSSCPQCRQIFTPRPTINRSTVLAELVEKMKRGAPRAVEANPVMSSAGSGDVDCDVCMENKLKAIKFCLVCVASYCETHIQTHYTSAALKRHKLVNASARLHEQICPQHDKPLELYCCQDQQLICMQCALINHQNHSMTSPAAKRQEIQEQFKSNQDDLQEQIHKIENKKQEVKQASVSHKRSAQAAVEHSEMIFTELISSLEKKRSEITEMIRNQEQAEERKAEELIHTLEQEICDLTRRNKELGQLSQIDDDIYFIQNFSSIYNYQCSNISNINVNQKLTFENIYPILTELKSQLNDLCEQDTVRISEKVPTVYIILNNEKIPEYFPSRPKTREEFLSYSSKLCLNHQSACTQLSVRNNSYVSWLAPGQAVYGLNAYAAMSKPLHKRVNRPFYQSSTFQSGTYQVLCDKSLSGCCYFEVEYAGTGCSIAFSYDQFDQAGGCFQFGCNNRSWIFDFPKAAISMLHTNVSIGIPIVTSKIGVYLDYCAGTLSFYSVTDKMTLLHRVQTTFTEPLFPGFALQKWVDGSVNICDLPFKPE
ncbi:E3 ubiquitin/ISG15 ligase TRIM25-like [Triplophysa rosa]|uniref:E3 ubiquitin/ISG15 ligase TRIM25-like n=1 Tax=Triplophysa rosa TaxID=992332 RepID=A0A9W7WPA8_TRIRA|nr:E3 ubiquitin/ISG15 ligase TRIM25-like [Triplophysa rosa]KAI7805833.1 putative E3 ubiquitin/ISG15 ligase TRIM25-like [Triplophysa rosa]